MKGTLARSSLTTSGLLGLRIATQAVVLILLTRLLGPGVYGHFAALASLALVLGMLPNLGAGYVLLARHGRDESGIADVWRYAWPITVLLGLVLLATYVAIADFITTLPLPTYILLTLGASELLLTPFTMLFSFALQARERVALSQYVQWLPLGLRVLAVWPCFVFVDAQRLYAYVLLQFVASLLGTMTGFWITRRHVEFDWRPRRATRQELRTGASYAVMNLVAANPSELDKIIAVRVVGASAAGIYAATTRVMNAAVTPVTAMLLASLPRLFRHGAAPTRQGLRLIRLIALISLGWGLASGALLAICSPLLPLLFGASFKDAASLMPWLAMVSPLLALRLSAGAVLIALGSPMQRVSFELGGILTLLIGIQVLGPMYGIQGLAIAMVLAEACMTALGWWLVRRRLTKHADLLQRQIF